MVDMINSYNQYSPSFTSANAGLYNGLKGAAVANSNEVRNMAKYLTGQPIAENKETTLGQDLKMTIPMLPIFGGLQAMPWIKDSNFITKKKGFPWINVSLSQPLQKIRDQKTAFLSNPANTRYNLAKNAGDVLKEKSNTLFHKLTDAEKVALQSNRGKLGKLLDIIPGYKSVRKSGFGQMMGKSGAGWMIAMDGAIKIFTEIVPTFKELGFSAGVKQLGKSLTHCVSSAVGWTAGEIAGSALGAAIGTAICPGVGTVVGKFVGGFLAGTAGMWFANKGAKAITGKSELEKSKDEQISKIEAEVQNNPDTKLVLAQNTLEQANNVLAQDPNNQEALEMKKIAEETIALAGAETSENTDADAETQVQTQPQQTGAGFGQMTGGIAIPPVPGFNGVSFDMDTYRASLATASMPSIPNNTNPYQTNPYQQNPYVQPQQQAVQNAK